MAELPFRTLGPGGPESSSRPRRENAVWKKLAAGAALLGALGGVKKGIDTIAESGPIRPGVSRVSDPGSSPSRIRSSQTTFSQGESLTTRAASQEADHGYVSWSENLDTQRELAERQAQEEEAERLDAANAPMTDDAAIDVTGQTEAQNLLVTGEIAQFLHRPKAFDDYLRSSLREQTRATADASVQVDRARDEALRVLREKAQELQGQGRFEEAVSYLALCDSREAFDLAAQNGRYDLAVQVFKDAKRDFGPTVIGLMMYDASDLSHLTPYLNAEEQEQVRTAIETHDAVDSESAHSQE